uniref:Uncharacterized protein n=1 Tax=Oryza brachyantha TaxID=4533 RepID=J3KV36_ORYBR
MAALTSHVGPVPAITLLFQGVVHEYQVCEGLMDRRVPTGMPGPVYLMDCGLVVPQIR